MQVLDETSRQTQIRFTHSHLKRRDSPHIGPNTLSAGAELSRIKFLCNQSIQIGQGRERFRFIRCYFDVEVAFYMIDILSGIERLIGKTCICNVAKPHEDAV